MKKYQLQLLTAIVTILTFVYTGCNKEEPSTYIDDCAGIECLNGGLCLDGNCHCPYGFEGKNCEYGWMTKYTGRWNVTETVINEETKQQVGEKRYYEVDISSDNGNTVRFVIDGFRGVDGYRAACVIGKNKLGYYVPSHKFIFVSNFPVSGSNIVVKEGEGQLTGAGGPINGTYRLAVGSDESVIFTAARLL